LTGRSPGLDAVSGESIVALSAQTGAGLDALRAYLQDSIGYAVQVEGGFSARRRHLEALQAAQDRFEAGVMLLRTQHAGELLAEELRLAQQQLGEITGDVSSDELLGRIFSSFCIGK
jgi:tRNA modification GTPase